MNPDLPVLALEISPLTERHHTGIANVTRNLASSLLRDETVDGRFFINRSEVARPLVERVLTLDDGNILWWVAGRTSGSCEIDLDPDQVAVGIYPGHKWHRRLFPTEVLVVHDITTLLQPHYHTKEAVAFWQSQLLADMLSSDLIVAVSKSTQTDILTYYPHVAAIPSIVAHLAPTVRDVPPADTPVEPYVMILGTLEPRKNVEVVLQVLSRRRDLLDQSRFIFSGRWGWGPDAQKLVRDYGLEGAVGSGRIVFTGFISDAVRDALMRNAVSVLYVSQYEGFGLPVLEALAAGTPVITGYGSSLPEAGGDVAIYCDVNSPVSVAAALESVLTSPEMRSECVKAQRRAWAAQFHWTTTYERIRDAALSAAARL